MPAAPSAGISLFALITLGCDPLSGGRVRVPDAPEQPFAGVCGWNVNLAAPDQVWKPVRLIPISLDRSGMDVRGTGELFLKFEAF